MQINKVLLDSFGKFYNKSIELDKGINLIYGKNEEGKSTVKNFIDFMMRRMADEETYKPSKSMLDKYKPWDNAEEYKGRIVIEEEGQSYMLRADFTKDSIEVETIGTEGNDNPPSFGMSGLVGVSELKDEKGNALLLDAIQRIENVKTTNSETIEYKETTEKLKQQIQELVNHHTYRKAQYDIEKLEDDLKYLKHRRNQLTDKSKKLLVLQNQVEEINQKIQEMPSRVENTAKMQEENQKKEEVEKYHKIIEINQEIKNLETELEHIDVYDSVDGEELQRFTRLRKKADDLKRLIDDKTSEINRLEKDIEEYYIDITEDVIEKFEDPEIITALNHSITAYNENQKSIQELESNIEDYRTMMNMDNVGENNLLTDEEQRELEKDYFKYMNISSWKEHVAVKVEELEANPKHEEYEKDIYKTTKRRKMDIVLLLFAILGIGTGPGLYFLYQPQIEYYGISIAGGVLFVLALFLFTRRSSSLRRYLIQRDDLQEELQANQKMLQDNIGKLRSIITKYSCEKEEEFFALYEEKGADNKNHSHISIKMNDLKEQLKQAKFSENIITKRLEQAFDEYNLKTFLAGRTIHEVARDFSDIIQQAKSYNDKKMALSTAIEVKGNMNYEYFSLQKIMEENPVKESNIETELIGIENRKKEYVEIEQRIHRLKEKKKTILGDVLEIEFIKKYEKEYENFEAVEVQALEIEDKPLKNGTISFAYEEEEEDYFADFSRTTKNEESFEILEETHEEVEEAHEEIEETYEEVEEDIVRHAKLEAEKEEALEQMEVLRQEISTIEKEVEDIKEKEYAHKQCLDIIEDTKEQIKAIENTLYNVKKASSEIVVNHKEKLERKVSSVIYDVTKKYDDIRIEATGEVVFKEETSGKWIEAKCLSSGTVDQIYLALRIGLLEIMSKDEKLPLILDDSFVQYDKKRLMNILEYIATLERQIILLSCHQREKNILDQLQIAYSYYELDKE